MEDNDYVLAFDHFYTNNHIQILKSLLPFMESGSSQMLPARSEEHTSELQSPS